MSNTSTRNYVKRDFKDGFLPMKEIESMSYKQLKEAGFIREAKVIYHNIKEDISNLVLGGMRKKQIKQIVADKYCLSVDSIHQIMYGGR